jgi:ubiquitin carboxyl-terminal hydrolase 16
MSDKQLAIATYAAGASLAAIALVYVFAPTYFIDGEPGNGSATDRKKGVVVGLSNTANDCFINSVLQALAGLGDLRMYLIRETHRRNLDDPIIYSTFVEDPARKSTPEWKAQGLQQGLVTSGLKQILDSLNERPLYKKTISAGGFIKCLEQAFRQRISRQQQDAQEFLQVVAERLCDEYHAGQRARLHNKGLTTQSEGRKLSTIPSTSASFEDGLEELALEDTDESGVGSEVKSGEDAESASSASSASGSSEMVSTLLDTENERSTVLDDDDDRPDSSEQPLHDAPDTLFDKEEGFPLEGKSESQIECLTCGFKPKPSESTFCTLTLNVPNTSSTTLNACFDGMFKTEYIDDFKCEKCRLVHAVETFEKDLAKETSPEGKAKIESKISSLKAAIESDPEQPPEDVELPDTKLAPQRKIARHIRITKFPKVMAIHLSRSIFDVSRSSTKNSAKVAFPERLPLGSIAYQRKYKLLGVVTHKGSHSSGHYESFRRQNMSEPFSTPNAFAKNGIYSNSGTAAAASPQVNAVQKCESAVTLASTPESLEPALASSTSLDSTAQPPNDNPSLDNNPGPVHRSAGIASASRDTLDIPSNNTSATNSATNSGANTPRHRSSRVSLDSATLKSAARAALSKVPSLSTLSSSSSPSKTTYRTDNAEANNTSTRASIRKSLSISAGGEGSRFRRRRKIADRWWRISDEKVKESKTSEVLAMNREVYLLFYELVRGENA